jgi:hypothetical protein
MSVENICNKICGIGGGQNEKLEILVFFPFQMSKVDAA